MDILKKVPYLLLLIAIIMNTIIGMISNITFISFLKRTILFYVVIFWGSHVFVSTILNTKKEERKASNRIDLTIPSEQPELFNMLDEEEQDFVPLDFKNYDINHDSKIS